jgi:hypothetical protein
MNLFEYTPQPYKSTRVDLPLDFIYKQLETKQKEFDAQAAAVDKATENFMKLDYGMLTEDAYKRVMESYLPRLESIRDNLFATGNVAMAAPDLAKFTTDLAGDPEVKNMLKDAQLTETYRQAVQQGLYTDKDLPGLFVAPGKLRDQLGVGQKTSPIYYSPMEFVDPLTELGAEADKYVKEIERDNPAVFRQTKDGRTITTQEGYKQRKYEKLREYLDARHDSWRLDPKNQGYFYRSTGSKPETYTKEKWISEVSDPLSKALAYENRSIETQISGTPNVPGLNKPSGDGTTDKKDSKVTGHPTRFTFSASTPGFPSYKKDDYVTNVDDFQRDIDESLADMRSAQEAISKLSGGTLAKGDPYYENYRNETREWIFNNYQVVDGRWELKPGSSAPAITPDISKTLSQFQDATISYNNRTQTLKDIKENAGVKNWDMNAIREAESSLMLGTNVPSGLDAPDEEFKRYRTFSDRAIIDYLSNKGMDPRSSEFRRERERLQSLSPSSLYSLISSGKVIDTPGISTFLNAFKDPQNLTFKEINKFLSEGKSKLLEGTNEGKVYAAFDNIAKKISQISISQLPDSPQTNNLESGLISLIQSAGIPAVDISNDTKLDKDDLDENFTKFIPINKDGTIDLSQVQTSIGYSPKYGVIGLISFGGKHYQVDLANSNIDQLFTDEYPEYAAELRMYDQVSKSLKRTGMREGTFNIGNLSFKFNLKSKNLSSANPEYSYEEIFDGTNTQQHSNLGTIFEKALSIANQRESLYDRLEEDINRQYLEEFNALDMMDVEGAKRLKQKRDERLENLRRAKTQGTTVGDESSGKSGEWRTSPKTPLK